MEAIGSDWDFFIENGFAGPYDAVYSYAVKSVYVPFEQTGVYAPGLGKRFYLPADPMLNKGNAVIKGVNIISGSQNSSCLSIPRRDNLSIGDLPKLSLVLANEEGDVIAWLPFADVCSFNSIGKPMRADIDDIRIDNCYVDVNSTAGINGSVGCWITFYYDEI